MRPKCDNGFLAKGKIGAQRIGCRAESKNAGLTHMVFIRAYKQ